MKTNLEKIKSWRLRRLQAGLSLENIAYQCDKTTAPQLSNYETGKVEPKARTIDSIEDILRKHGV